MVDRIHLDRALRLLLDASSDDCHLGCLISTWQPGTDMVGSILQECALRLVFGAAHLEQMASAIQFGDIAD